MPLFVMRQMRVQDLIEFLEDLPSQSQIRIHGSVEEWMDPDIDFEVSEGRHVVDILVRKDR